MIYFGLFWLMVRYGLSWLILLFSIAELFKLYFIYFFLFTFLTNTLGNLSKKEKFDFIVKSTNGFWKISIVKKTSGFLLRNIIARNILKKLISPTAAIFCWKSHLNSEVNDLKSQSKQKFILVMPETILTRY